MTVSVITACYNFEDRVENYLDSLFESIDNCKFHRPDFNLVFIIDEPNKGARFEEIIEEYKSELATAEISVHVIQNESNIGVTRSRNRGARYIKEKLLDDSDWVIYFDIDDTWDIESVTKLKMLEKCEHDFVFFPCDVDTIPINKEILNSSVELGKFCTYVPLQEAIYAWRNDYFKSQMSSLDYLWYEDESPSKYFPEDMVFYLTRTKTAWITDKVLCHRTYDNGNIAKDWKSTIIKNKSAFRKLSEFHKTNAKYFQYSPKLWEYIEYIDYLTKSN